jgi:hypothetical protein
MSRQTSQLIDFKDFEEVELEIAKEKLLVAYNQFNNCDADLIDYCIFKIEAYKAKIDSIVKKNKTGGPGK